MDDTGQTLTLDQAVSLMPDDHSAGSVALYEESTPQEPAHVNDPGTIEEPAERHGKQLTLDEASEIELADDEEVRQIASSEKPVAVLEGKPLTLPELVTGYATRKQLETAAAELQAHHEEVQAAGQGIIEAAWQLSGLMVKLMPPEPDINLSYVNPGEYTRLKAHHEAVYGQASQVLMGVQAAKDAADGLAVQHHGRNLISENAKLIEHFPECADPEGREQFFDRIRDVAYTCDFSENEMRAVSDHRLFRLAYLAVQGMEAAERLTRHKPKKPRKKHSTAYERLTASGSIDDAVMVDFD